MKKITPQRENEFMIAELFEEVTGISIVPVESSYCLFNFWNKHERVAVEIKARNSYKSTEFRTTYLSTKKLDKLFKLTGENVKTYLVVAWSDATGILNITHKNYRLRSHNLPNVVYEIPVSEFYMYRALKLKPTKNRKRK